MARTAKPVSHYTYVAGVALRDLDWKACPADRRLAAAKALESAACQIRRAVAKEQSA